MSIESVMRRTVVTVLAVACGGALGAVLRAVVADVGAALGLVDWLVTGATNALGGLAIGSVFVHLEARYRAHQRSRLADTPHGPRMANRGWPVDVDQTLDPVDLFRADTPIRLWSGFLVTGGLGGFTTFSTFAVEMNSLGHSGSPLEFALGLALTALVPVWATFAGLHLGEWTLPDRS